MDNCPPNSRLRFWNIRCTFSWHLSLIKLKNQYLSTHKFCGRAIFSNLHIDTFFLEYDDARSGGFEPLRFIPHGKRVVLGLITTKHGRLENKAALQRRIDEAAQYVPMEHLAISPQCGFASVFLGNLISQEDQIKKLRLVVETAHQVWGSMRG